MVDIYFCKACGCRVDYLLSGDNSIEYKCLNRMCEHSRQIVKSKLTPDWVIIKSEETSIDPINSENFFLRKITEKEFVENILHRRFDRMEKVLAGKNKEYAGGEDYLFNFRTGSRISERHPVIVLWGYFLKQLICVIRMMLNPEKEYTQEYVDEKIGDVMNYLVLYEGILYASKNKK